MMSGVRHPQTSSVGILGSVNSPKLDRESRSTTVYPYYAGFSTAFVASLLEALNLDAGATILDPWNGSGTTTLVAAQAGLRATGYDLNPVMPVIAEARCAKFLEVQEARRCAAELVEGAPDREDPDDLLNAWFTPASVLSIRRVIRSVAQFDFSVDGRCEKAERRLRAVMYLGLFRAIRELLRPFWVSNPTWIKQSVLASDRIAVTLEEFRSRFASELSNLALIAARVSPTVACENQPITAVASATALPDANGTFDAVVTSPPYCTRIDYAVKTLPELAVLGTPRNKYSELRRTLMGTTTVQSRVGEVGESWGGTCKRLLEAIKMHPSKASAGYYLRGFMAYFNQLAASVAEIARVAKPGAWGVTVVQGSYYKEVFIDLPTILTEMADVSGLRLVESSSFVATQSMSAIKARNREGAAEAKAAECVLLFKKEVSGGTDNGRLHAC